MIKQYRGGTVRNAKSYRTVWRVAHGQVYHAWRKIVLKYSPYNCIKVLQKRCMYRDSPDNTVFENPGNHKISINKRHSHGLFIGCRSIFHPVFHGEVLMIIKTGLLLFYTPICIDKFAQMKPHPGLLVN